MDRGIKNQMRMHYSASLIGGFLGGYAIYNFYELFANAQTANMIHLVQRLFTKDFGGLLFTVISLITYIAGNAFYVIYKKYGKTELRAVSIIIDALAIVAVGIITHFTNATYALIPILFAMPVQWNAFSGDAGYASSTIFSTNNLRQAATSLVSYILDKDEAMLKKSKFFCSTLLFFHIGVAVVCVASIKIGVGSIWLGFIPVAVTAIAYMKYRKVHIAVRRKFRKLFSFAFSS